MKATKKKRYVSQINPSLKNQIVRTFAQALADINDFDEMLTFLRDFFTDSEIEMFAKRLAVSYWLKKGRTYENITNNLKASSATISQVGGLMKTKGFIDALKKIEAEEWATVWAKRIKKFVGR